MSFARIRKKERNGKEKKFETRTIVLEGMCRDERVQISLRTAQFSYVVVASTSRELNLAILPIPLTSKDRSFCRGGFNKPCT